MWKYFSSAENVILFIIRVASLLLGWLLFYRRLTDHLLGGAGGWEHHVHPWEGLTLGVAAWVLTVATTRIALASVRSVWILSFDIAIAWIFLAFLVFPARFLARLFLEFMIVRSLYNFPTQTPAAMLAYVLLVSAVYLSGVAMGTGPVFILNLFVVKVMEALGINC